MYTGSAQEIGTSSVRLFVALYKGMPYDLTTDIYLPESAATILKTRTLSSEQAAYLAKHTVPNLGAAPALSAPQTAPQATPQATEAPAAQSTPKAETPAASSTDRTVKGTTTFVDLLGWGVSQPTIEKVLGTSMPSAQVTKIKDYCTEKGLNFETIRPALQAEVDKVK